MGRSNKKARRRLSVQGLPDARTRKAKVVKLLLAAVFVATLAGSLGLILWLKEAMNPRPVTPQGEPTSHQTVQSFAALLTKTPEQLKGLDVAEMNLLCATGLPGAEKMYIAGCLAKLDEWASRVKEETDRYLYRWLKNPAAYRNSEGYFRMLSLVTVLQKDCGVHYNLARVRDVDFTKSKDLFLHGMIDDPNGGTCVSMPVMYVAVGRRLGYPLRLVLAKAHVFFINPILWGWWRDGLA